MISLRKTIALSFCFANFLSAFSYKISGSMAEFSKVGFNNRPINTKLGYYPTETFAAVTGFLNVKADLLPKNVYNHSFTAKIGFMGGGLAYDGTKNLIDQATGKPFGSMMWMYYGAWHGYLGAGGWGTDAANGMNNPGNGGYLGNRWMSQHVHDIILNEAYVEYGYKKIFRIKAGRYAGNAYFMDGYTEGFEATLNLRNFTFWWFSSYGMSWTYDEWIYDYFAPIVTTNKHGKHINLGIHSGSITWHKKGLSITPFFISRQTLISLQQCKLPMCVTFRSNTIEIYLSIRPLWVFSLSITLKTRTTFFTAPMQAQALKCFFSSKNSPLMASILAMAFIKLGAMPTPTPLILTLT